MQLDGVYTVADDLTILAKELKTEENLLNARFKNNNPWGQIGIGGKLQPGIGICGILGVRGVFTLNVVLRQLFDKTAGFSSKSSGAMITMGGGVGVDLLLFSFDYDIGNLKFAWGIYDKNNVSLSSAEDEANISIRQLDRGKETDTIFGKEQVNLMSSLEPVNKTDIVTGTMEYVRPEIVNLGDGRLMMIYLKNDETRDSANAASLVYTIKENGVWREPVYIDSDGTADGPADILCDGNKVYIAWSSTDTPATATGDDINAVKQDLQKMNIRMCIYDTAADTLSDTITVTSDEYLNSDVRLAKENGDIALYYLKKDIQNADSAEKLISTTANYSTWAKRVFDPDSDSFIKITSDGGSEVDEKLIYIKHPTVADPLVYDYAVEKYTYNNGTNDDTADDVEYSIAAYSVDRDKNINTNNDREVWLELTDITDGKTYYPIKVSAQSNNIINPKLTAVNGDVLLTWLSDTSVFNTISMTAFFEAMKNQTGNVDGTYTGTTAFDLMRSLNAEEAASRDWGSVLEERAKASMSAGDIDSFDELFSSISDIVNGSFATNPKNFADEDEQINMSDYQIVVGDDKNAYLFWTGAGLGLTNYGKELYGTAYYRLSDEWKEEWGESSDMPDSGWGEPVQLTEYGEVIDEMTIAVDENKNAVIIANMFKQTIDENGYVKQGEHMVSGISDEIEVTVEGTEPTPTRKPSSGRGSSSKATPTPTASAEPTTEPTATPNPTSEPSGETVNRFADVPQDVWYYDAVKAVFDRKLMVGVDDTHFEPETDVTRGMFATTLYRLENEPEISTEYTFNDIAQDAYYANAVAWANANGIVEGYSESEFAPDEKITREQMAAMMYRYVKYKGADTSIGENTNILSYDDFDKISEYAIPAMQWSAGSGVMVGRTDTTLNPLETTTRAETAAVLNRIIEYLK